MAKQIKSRDRVMDHGEVFTNEREVNAMLDMVVSDGERIGSRFSTEYAKACKNQINVAFLDAIRTVVDRNILCGNALSMKMVDAEQNDTDEPIIFSEWTLAMGGKVKRRDFRLDELLEGQRQQMSLFGLSGSNTSEWEYDEELQAYIPLPIREFPLMDIYQIGAAA